MRALTKNLANCTPEEFLVQTNKIRKSAERWLEVTDILNIRKNVPKLEVPKNATPEEADAALQKHKAEVRKAAKENFNKILDSVMGEHPKETLEILALLNFVEPSDINKYRVTDYLANITDIINDDAVVSFFTSLIRLEQTSILSA